MQRQIRVCSVVLMLLVSGCAGNVFRSEPGYHVHGWGYTTGYPMFLPRDNVNYVPAASVYGTTYYNGDGFFGY